MLTDKGLPCFGRWNFGLDDKERVYVGDFGLAHLAGASVVLTRSGMVAGTPQYMAPEQALGKKADHRADIYALGIVAYQMLTGAVPFEADTPVAVLLKHANEPVPIPPLDQVPETLMRTLLRALDKDPAARWQTALAFTATLDQGLAEAANGSTVVAAERTAMVTPETGPVGEGPTTHSLFSPGRARAAEDKPAVPPAPGRSPIARWRLGVTAVTLVGVASGYFVAAGLRDDHPITEDPPMTGGTPIQLAVGAPSPQPDEPRLDRPKTTPEAIPAVAEDPRPTGQPAQKPADEAPAEIAPETGFDLSNVRGVEGGIVGGVVSGLLRAPPPPPPPAEPIRVGGNVSAPVKTKHIDPRYPEMARAARVSGVVILETVIGPDGRVTDVKILRSVPLLDDAALEAVRQWEYTPTLLNGVPVPVIMTVTVNFQLR